MPAHVVTVNLGSREPNPAKTVGVTGILKRPVDAATLRAPGPKRGGLGSGLVGDFIGDVRSHGGDDQAVYAFAREGLDSWEAGPPGARQRLVRGEPHDAGPRRRRLVGRRPVGGRRRGGAARHRPADSCATFAARMGIRGGSGGSPPRRAPGPTWRSRRAGSCGPVTRSGWSRVPSTTSTCRPRSGRSWAISTRLSACWPWVASRSTRWRRCGGWWSGAEPEALDPLCPRPYRGR